MPRDAPGGGPREGDPLARSPLQDPQRGDTFDQMIPPRFSGAKPYYSYTGRDLRFFEQLKTVVRSLERKRWLEPGFSRVKAPPGDLRAAFVDSLHEADLFIPLVTHDYIGDDECDHELQLAGGRLQAEGASLEFLPILLGHVLPSDRSEGFPNDLEWLPDPLRPLSEWEYEARAWSAVKEGIRTALYRVHYRRDALSSDDVGFLCDRALTEEARCARDVLKSVFGRVALDALRGHVGRTDADDGGDEPRGADEEELDFVDKVWFLIFHDASPAIRTHYVPGSSFSVFVYSYTRLCAEAWFPPAAA